MHHSKIVSIIIALILVIGAVCGVGVISNAQDAPDNSVNLTVGENIVSHYYIDAEFYRSKGCDEIRYTYNGTDNKEEYTAITKTVEIGSDDTITIDAYQSAAQIAEPTVIEALKNNEVYDTVSYSSKTYCDAIINMVDDDLINGYTRGIALKNLCKAIVTYGKAAQGAFNYNSDTVAGATTIESDYSTDLSLESASFTPSVEKTAGSNVRFRTASFLCTSSAKLRFYLQVNDTSDPTSYGIPEISMPKDCSYEKGYVVSGGVPVYYIQINNIKPVDFDEKIVINYAGASVSMSVLDYAGAVINSSAMSAADKTLAKSLIVYSDKAEDYFTSHKSLEKISAVAPTCTESGNIEYWRCNDADCGKFFEDEECDYRLSDEAVIVPALGHSFGEWTVTTEATCTADGEETRECSRCDVKETRQVEATGHSYTSVVTAPTCTAQGYTTFTCTRCGDTYKDDYTDASGHTPADAVEENRIDATCSATGSYDSVVYCSVCEAELSRTNQTINALGHNYNSVVTAPTCTVQGYTTYTCSRCGDSYVSDYSDAIGHNYGAWTVTTAATLSADGTETRICANDSSHKETRTIQHFTFKLPNTDSYLYRVGNGNNVTLGTFFGNESGADITGITVTTTKNSGSASCTYTANASDWRNGTLKFANTGVMTVTLKHGEATVKSFKLEVVAGTNYTEGANLGGVTSNNAVLLGNVNVPATVSINNGKTLYGNGFNVTDTRSSTAGTSGYINMTGGGTINNAVMLGQVYKNAVSSGNNNENYAPGIWITGNANIYNSYVSECKYAAQIDGGEVNLVNSTFAGGAIANVCIAGGEVTLENCTTATSNRNGLKGLGVRVTSTDAKIILNGTFKQYNWLKNSEVYSDYSGILSSIYDDSNYAYTYNSQKYINMGIFFITEANNITSDQAQETIEDNTSNSYGYIQKTAAGRTGAVYTAKASMGSADMLSMPAYSETVNGQYFIVPASTFNYTKNDFTTDDKTYCTYNSTTKITNISFVEGSSVQWDTSILTVTKNGNSITPTVTMNNTDYSGKKITFTEAGDYNVVYSYTDPYNYDKEGAMFSHTYTKTVKIHVSTVEQSVQIYHPDFTYANIGGTTASKQVEATVSGSNRVYVMPNVSATSSSIGSTTVGGKTVYFPIVTVDPKSSSGVSYSSGNIHYFAPAFKHINITDYDQDNQTTKTAKYTYNSSTQKWPHNISSSSKPTTEYYYYTSTVTSTNTNRPYGRSMNEQYYGYNYNSSLGGLCFESKEISKDNTANSQLVEFYYKGTDNVTYYYYIKYSFTAATYKSSGCVAEGSQVTMADGTKKAVEDVKAGDMVLTWSMWKGKYEAQPVIKNMYHGTEDWDVLTLNFSNGSSSRSVIDHGYYDADKNNYVYINTDNVESYIGDTFAVQNENGDIEKVTLTDYSVTVENVGIYNVISAYNINCFIDDVLTISPEVYAPGLFEYFNIGDDMVFDKSQITEEIAQYGFYDYSQFSEYVSEEAFDMLNLKYYKIFVERGDVDYDALIKMIVTYICD